MTSVQVLVIAVGVALILVGLYFAVGGLGTEGASGGGHGVTIEGPAWLVLVAIGVAVILFASVHDFDDEDSVAGERTSTARPDESSGTGSDGSDDDSPASTTSATTTTTGGSGGCEITVRNPLATIHEEPDTFSQEIVRVPSGTYGVEEFATGDFGSRWLRITVSSRTGWLEDSTFNVDAKSDACP